MIVIYIFLAFLFYKIFPALADMPDNTVLGAALMAICTGLILQAGEIIAIRQFVGWQNDELTKEFANMFPFGAATAVIGAAALATLSCALIAEGFASRLAAWAARRNEIDFFVMAGIPPAVHTFWKMVELLRGAANVARLRKQMGQQRKDADDKDL